jgi:DNA-binding transcriptional LysR family regulator
MRCRQVQYPFRNSSYPARMTLSIDLRHLRHFIALAEELHFGRAARRCNMSIRQLEEALGFALVQRSTHEVRLTAAGAAYYEDAQKVLAQLERATLTATRANQGLDGSIEVGFFASMLYRGLDRAVKRFKQGHPGVALRLVELSTSDQLPALLRHRIQYGFVHTAALPEGVLSQVLWKEPFVLCVPEAHALAGKASARLADVAGSDFVLFSRAFSPAYYDQVVSLCVAAGFHPEIQHEARHWLTVLACVSRGLGVTLVPRSLANSGFFGVSFVPVEESGIESVLRGVWLQRGDTDPALAAWHATVVSEIAA